MWRYRMTHWRDSDCCERHFGGEREKYQVPQERVEPIRSEATTMIYLTALIALFLFVYLFTAMIRPEWF